ncbi:MAG TPA: anhydro-N-acetylmuramic acid kinase [Burkholderiaceae bacterium]|nr:anhydro-N-acetylmuramic acid kinase [Burkholderiaceae bacterium]
MNRPVRLYAGLMSGTSVDAVDGVLAGFHDDTSPAGSLAFSSRPIPLPLRDALQSLQRSGADELARAALAANELSDLYAEVISDLLDKSGRQPAEIEAIGAHGQTVRHRPECGYTIQLLNPSRLAERSGIAVVADLRSADVAAGGQGAPLAPGFHHAAFGAARERRAIANLGGIANVSLIPAADEQAPVRGFDTGPANTLLDYWCLRHTGHDFDRDGSWAAGGRVIEALLARMLEEPYFSAPAPKSTGRDLFEAGWLQAALRSADALDADPRDVQATLAELTAITVAKPCIEFGATAVRVCGGGARNPDLMARLRRRAAPATVEDTSALGIDPQAVEALAFAWLACRRLAGLPGNVPAVTGATGPRLLGGLWPATR